jgi:3-hydroxybutyrate dehydrogenase
MDMQVHEQMSVMSPLAGRVAIVTGSTSGIGLGIARALAQAGADVVINGLGDRREIDFVCAELDKICPAARVAYNGANLMKPDEATRLVTDTIADFGRVDILVNNAGVTWAAEPEDMPLDKWQKVVDINLTGAFLFAQAAGRDMLKRQHGRIINIASIAGMHASVHGPHYAAYAATKAGLIGLTRELAVSWARKGIRVNAIAPGFFHSRLADGAIEMNEGSIKASSPIPRVGDAGELKGVAVFLAADASNYITGQTIVVDGGRTIA